MFVVVNEVPVATPSATTDALVDAPLVILMLAPEMLVVTLMVPFVETNFSDFFRPLEALINTGLAGCE